ncbi:unnamed protein product [Amoebophrya sp. A25]|nr:unnamed protein product [Amoebophrya sp. A25]|eukprot:GSA25T00016492001.1
MENLALASRVLFDRDILEKNRRIVELEGELKCLKDELYWKQITKEDFEKGHADFGGTVVDTDDDDDDEDDAIQSEWTPLTPQMRSVAWEAVARGLTFWENEVPVIDPETGKKSLTYDLESNCEKDWPPEVQRESGPMGVMLSWLALQMRRNYGGGWHASIMRRNCDFRWCWPDAPGGGLAGQRHRRYAHLVNFGTEVEKREWQEQDCLVLVGWDISPQHQTAPAPDGN